MRIQISGARLIDPASQTDRICDIFIEGGKIAANTRSPVILNLKTRKGMQKVLSEVHPALLYRAR